MEVIRFNGKITVEDIENLNKNLPKVIEISSTKGQSAEILSKLNPEIKVKIIDEEPSKKGDFYDENSSTITVEELCKMLNLFEKMENEIDVNWTDLEASLHTYIELIKNSREEYPKLQKAESLENLSETLALKYREAIKRLDIPCKYLKDEKGFAWNEIEIDGKNYKVDLLQEVIDNSEKDIDILKFLTPVSYDKVKNEKEDKVEHKNESLQIKEDEKQSINEKDILKAYEVISSKRNIFEERERPKITVKSKELAGIFKGNEITKEDFAEVKSIKIALKDADISELSEDLKEISTYYPEVLENVEIENTTNTHINMQQVVDQICEPKDDLQQTDRNISITVSSKFAEDFDLDFSNVPAIPTNQKSVDSEKKQRIVLKNISDTAIKIPSLKGKISPNITEIETEGLDLENLDISETNVKSLKVNSELSKNIANIKGVENLTGIRLEAVNQYEFSSVFPMVVSATSNIHDFDVSNVDLKDNKILESLATNPNLTNIKIFGCSLNNLDGLEQFDGRLAYLNIMRNELPVAEIGRLSDFRARNPYLTLYANDNSSIVNTISALPEISDNSHIAIEEQFYSPGIFQNRINKVDSVNFLLYNAPNIPYYIKDAETIRKDLNIKLNPMMIENDDEIDTFDFNKDYLRDGTLLLTIPQIERLISSGRTIPQNIRIRINDVSELSSQKTSELLRDISSKGMNLSEVQILDKNADNELTETTPYSINQYIYIRETLDKIVSGINPNEPDLDKFAVIYQRLMDSIKYDYDVIGTANNSVEALYKAEKHNSSRNLLEGLEEGKCVCAGYADILRNALSLVGINSRLNTGNTIQGRFDTRHAWNQIYLDDGSGTKRWYNTDLTWDAELSKNDYTLLGEANFKKEHQQILTQDIENVERNDYNRVAVRNAFARAKNRSFDFRTVGAEIDIPEDPKLNMIIIDPDKIAEEYRRRKNDMYAKFYGDGNYQKEFEERNRRYKNHEIEMAAAGITYKTIEDYPEKEDDEKFLLLDKYKEALERKTRYEAGDTAVYTGTQVQIDKAFEKDKEYVETRNHTFDQHKNTQKDLSTLGKYGERMPYIPKQTGAVKNIVRAVGNVGIFTRNLVSPVYRVVGRYVAQPLHRMITNNKEASPYRNNWYHRMVARRDYFEDINNTSNPGHPIRNAIKSRVEAITQAQKGNEAVLRAGAADIRENIVRQEKEKMLLENLKNKKDEFDTQIQSLEEEIRNNPNAVNINDVIKALEDKKNSRDNVDNLIANYANKIEGTSQTDAVSDKQHAIASKEVNTMRVTAIKGVAKGIAIKYVGPKVHEWLLERGKTTRSIDIKTEVPETKSRWVEPTYKNETVPIYEDVIDTKKTMSDIISTNKGKDVTGFYSVYGGEKGASTYTLTGNEKITAIFQSKGLGGKGLSDNVGLKAPTFTDGTFSSGLLDANGFLNQNTTLTELVEALNEGNIDVSKLSDMYVSVGDRYWTKLSDLVGNVTTKVKVGEEVKQVLDVAGHYEDYTEMVEKIITTTEVVTNPAIKKAVNLGSKIEEGTIMVDGILDLAENLRKTTSDVKSNKKEPRKYTFNEEVGDVPKSKKEYKKHVDEGR